MTTEIFKKQKYSHSKMINTRKKLKTQFYSEKNSLQNYVLRNLKI